MLVDILLFLHHLLICTSSILNFLAFGFFLSFVGLIKLLTLSLHLLFQAILFVFQTLCIRIFLGLNFLHLALQVHLQLSLFVSLCCLPCMCFLTDMEFNARRACILLMRAKRLLAARLVHASAIRRLKCLLVAGRWWARHLGCDGRWHAEVSLVVLEGHRVLHL